MCGIFGILCAGDDRISPEFARSIVLSLLRFSETRGREAAGLAVHNGTRIEVLKQAGSVATFLKNPRFQDLLGRSLESFAERRSRADSMALAITGHSRLVTNGAQSNDDNNQPVVAHGSVVIHNGIVVNDRELARRYPDLAPKSEVDSEILVALLRKKLDEHGDLVGATRATFAEIEGSASVSVLFDHLECLLLATNTGSLFYLSNARGTVIAFASERFILQRLMESEGFDQTVGACTLQQIRAGTALAVHLRDLSRHAFTLAPAETESEAAQSRLNGRFSPNGHAVEIIDHTSRAKDLRRCKRCILPQTYPFMDFDSEGVCRYCRNWRKITVKGEEALLRAVEPYRSKDGSPDVIVAFSGGRDSAYGLHYVKQKLGMNPVAFTYDWGMVTDLARRNQARVCGKLGVEHILRSAAIATKRRYIRKNVEAWLKKPELGMVTLFTAGDKEFYKYARLLRKETGIKLVIFCTGNMIEDTPYKTGLCGIREDDHGMTLTGLSTRNEMALLWYYFRNYLKNPAYINESLIDTFNAYWQTFVVKDDFLYLYHYLEWREEEIVGTIRREYDWEVAQDTTTTWRIGDGTAPFYNYIYQTIAGFTEDEVMLSNMIREGHLSREEAARRAEEYRKPRYASIREYAQLAGFNCEEALSVINAAPKLF
jgi:glutamine---fructose-6-phosphate transaminase (isomerizing)